MLPRHGGDKLDPGTWSSDCLCMSPAGIQSALEYRPCHGWAFRNRSGTEDHGNDNWKQAVTSFAALVAPGGCSPNVRCASGRSGSLVFVTNAPPS